MGMNERGALQRRPDGSAPLDAVRCEGDAAAIIGAAEKFGEAQRLEIEPGAIAGSGRFVLVVPEGRQVVNVKPYLDHYRTAPERKEGTARLTTLESFIDHVNRHKDGGTVVFASDDRDKPALEAVIDYQHAGPEGAPRFGKHRARYDFPLSDEWKAWMGKREPMAQAAFAEFLEDRIGDALPATEATADFAIELGVELAGPQRLLELSRGLAVRVGQSVKNAQSLASGEVSVVFEETHQGEDGAPLKVPGGFVLGIPVFRGGARYRVPVRLRYRVEGRSISWRFVPHRTDLVFRDAFDEAVTAVREKTELLLLYGAPES